MWATAVSKPQQYAYHLNEHAINHATPVRHCTYKVSQSMRKLWLFTSVLWIQLRVIPDMNVLSPVHVQTVEAVHQPNHWNVWISWWLQQIIDTAIAQTQITDTTIEQTSHTTQWTQYNWQLYLLALILQRVYFHALIPLVGTGIRSKKKTAAVFYNKILHWSNSR